MPTPRILTDEDIETIKLRWATRVTRRVLAREFGVSEETIKHLVSGRCYRGPVIGSEAAEERDDEDRAA